MFIWPMLLQPSEPFTSDDYIFEWKSDGIRLLLSSMNGDLRLYTRHKTECTRRFPEVSSIPFKENIVLDGELISINPDTKMDDWELVMKRFQLTDPFKINTAMKTNPVIYMVFDILYYDDKTLFHLPLLERKEILKRVLPSSPHLQEVYFIENEGEMYFDKIVEMELEGCVAKRKKGLYYPGKRMDEWLKIIRFEYYDVVLTGIHKESKGFLCSFVNEEGLKPAGVVEFASKELRHQIHGQAIKGEENNIGIRFKEPIRAIVKTRGLTKNGYLRTPVLFELN